MKNTELVKEGVTHDLVVVAFDMCSSSKLIEDLSRTGSLAAYDRFLKSLYYWLSFHSTKLNYLVYKFTGDGWLILFPASMVDGAGLMRFLVRLVAKHNALRAKLVDVHLESIPASNGLTIGVEMGEVRKFFLDDQIEFTGRALNIACRLQGAVKEKDAEPDYRCLFSRKVFNTYLKKVKDFEFADVERSLRNISDGERYRCVKVDLSAHIRA